MNGFRVWDKVYKHMITSDYQVEINVDGSFNVYSRSREGERFYCRESKDFALMRSTGIADKSGKEIYEGDIVVQDGYIGFDEEKPNYRGTVEWIYSQWQVVAHCVNPDKRGISDGKNESLNDVGIEESQKSAWEVVGNIWDNPELVAL